MTDDMPLERLEAEITTLAAHLAAGTCRWLLLVAEFDRRRAWESWECRSTAAWLSWKCGIAYRTARDQLRVGQALTGLPQLTAAFGRGEVSYSQVRAITRVATVETEGALVDLAKASTAAQLERVIRATTKALGLDEVNDRHSRRSAVVHVLDDGSYEIRVRLSPEDGELAKVTIEAFTDALPYDAGSAEPRDARRADGFIEMVRAARDADPIANDSTDRATVMLVDERDGTRLSSGVSLHPDTAQRLACDSAVIALYMKDGQPLDIGRKTRSIPTSINRAMRRRDGHRCRFPGCDATRFLQGHHIQHWTSSGPTKVENLVLLCPFHHRLHHEGRYTVSVNVLGRIEFRKPGGALVATEPRRADGPDLLTRNAQLDLGITERTSQPMWWSGDRLDLEMAVDAAVGLRRLIA
ncbi:MAG: DUF222 domain-containing protein [Acidobacteria bacterium]|nr:DUF222 domain-containing protein [Acidobacteriota bacterium]